MQGMMAVIFQLRDYFYSEERETAPAETGPLAIFRAEAREALSGRDFFLPHRRRLLPQPGSGHAQRRCHAGSPRRPVPAGRCSRRGHSPCPGPRPEVPRPVPVGDTDTQRRATECDRPHRGGWAPSGGIWGPIVGVPWGSYDPRQGRGVSGKPRSQGLPASSLHPAPRRWR